MTDADYIQMLEKRLDTAFELVNFLERIYRMGSAVVPGSEILHIEELRPGFLDLVDIEHIKYRR